MSSKIKLSLEENKFRTVKNGTEEDDEFECLIKESIERK